MSADLDRRLLFLALVWPSAQDSKSEDLVRRGFWPLAMLFADLGPLEVRRLARLGGSFDGALATLLPPLLILLPVPLPLLPEVRAFLESSSPSSKWSPLVGLPLSLRMERLEARFTLRLLLFGLILFDDGF